MAERRTPLYDVHLRTTSKMVKGGGDYLYPLSYTSQVEEHFMIVTSSGPLKKSARWIADHALGSSAKGHTFGKMLALGYVTSTKYGYNLGKQILYGYLPLEYAQEGTHMRVEYFARCYAATVAGEPLYDPDNKKLRL